MNLSRYLIGGLVAAVAAGALVFALSPATITGDREADAACEALAVHLGATTDDGGATMRRLSGPALAELVDEVTGHTEKSSLSTIKSAGDQLTMSAVEVGPFAPLTAMQGVLGVAQACQAEGWSAQKAGLVP